MGQNIHSSQSIEVQRQRTPLPVKIAALLIFTGGILLVVLVFGNSRSLGNSGAGYALLLLGFGLGNIVISSGVGTMRKWGLYWYGFIVVLFVVFLGLVSLFESTGFLFCFAGVAVILLIYLWSIRSKFV